VQSRSIDEKRFTGNESPPSLNFAAILRNWQGRNPFVAELLADFRCMWIGGWLRIIYEWEKLLFRKLLGPPPALIAVSPFGKSRFVTWLIATLLWDSRSSIRPPSAPSHGRSLSLSLPFSLPLSLPSSSKKSTAGKLRISTKCCEVFYSITRWFLIYWFLNHILISHICVKDILYKLYIM